MDYFLGIIIEYTTSINRLNHIASIGSANISYTKKLRSISILLVLVVPQHLCRPQTYYHLQSPQTQSLQAKSYCRSARKQTCRKLSQSTSRQGKRNTAHIHSISPNIGPHDSLHFSPADFILIRREQRAEDQIADAEEAD